MSVYALLNFILLIIYNKSTKSFSTKFIIFNIIFSSISDILIFFKIFISKFFRCRHRNEKNNTLLILSKMLNLTIISTRLLMLNNFIEKNINNMFKYIFSLNSLQSRLFTFLFSFNLSKIFAKKY